MWQPIYKPLKTNKKAGIQKLSRHDCTSVNRCSSACKDKINWLIIAPQCKTNGLQDCRTAKLKRNCPTVTSTICERATPRKSLVPCQVCRERRTLCRFWPELVACNLHSQVGNCHTDPVAQQLACTTLTADPSHNFCHQHTPHQKQHNS